jgi:hypothetical protein
MEDDMTTTRKLIALFAPLAGAALAIGSPAAAASEDGRAVAQCRAEVLRTFPAETIRSQRIASISGNSRHTRVAIAVTTDRRYTLDCRADAEGRVVTASWNPNLGTRLASTAPASQGQ